MIKDLQLFLISKHLLIVCEVGREEFNGGADGRKASEVDGGAHVAATGRWRVALT